MIGCYISFRIDYKVLTLCYKSLHDLAPSYMTSMLSYRDPPSDRVTVRNYELHLLKEPTGRLTTHGDRAPSWRITNYKKSFLPFAVHLWNSLDDKIQAITNYKRFKDALGLIQKVIHYFYWYQTNRNRMRCSNLNDHLRSIVIAESSAYPLGFINEDEFHFFFICPLFNRPRITLQNVISCVAPFTIRTSFIAPKTNKTEI